MNTRKRFKDYPLSFWFAVLATITAAILAISSYSRMINDDAATLKAAMIVISFEGALIVAMAVLNGRLQGLLKGWAFVMLGLLAMAEVFMASMEIQHGIAQAGANAENFTLSASNAGTVASSMADATRALADCDKRYPRKQKDAAARAQCRKPYEKIVAASAGAMPSNANNTPQYDADDAGQLKQWQSVADVMNETWKPTKLVTWNQAAFYIMTSIMALFVIVKNFLWAKYAHEGALKADSSDYDEHPHVTISESSLGNNAQTERKPFGFTPSQPAPSSAAINRAKYLHVSTLDPIHAHVNKHVHVNTHEHVNNMHVSNNQSSEKSTNYDRATSAKVGSLIDCPQCGTTFRKANKWHTFCKPTCRDTWHNAQDPNRVQYLKNRKRKNP